MNKAMSEQMIKTFENRAPSGSAATTGYATPPISVVAYGGGTNSTAMLIKMSELGLKVDLILFSDTGGERPKTYDYINLFSEWLTTHGIPLITIVSDHISLEQDCLNRKTLPAIAFGFKTCSQHFKIRPIEKFLKGWGPAKKAWELGNKITKFIGYDAGESYRAKNYNDEKYILRYPLIEWGYGREECMEIIESAGLPQPGKSSCFFCPSMRPYEVLQLKKKYPDLLDRALKMEAQAKLTAVKGLGRNYSWTKLVKNNEMQMDFFCNIEQPCECYDGE